MARKAGSKPRPKSKARQEYERLRRNLTQARNRAVKAGSQIYFDLPETPKQAGKKGTYKEYQKAATQLKRLKKLFETARAEEKKEFRRRTEEKAVAQQIIDNLMEDLNAMGSQAKGADYIRQKLSQLSDEKGAVKLAAALNELNASGLIITRKEMYHSEAAVEYIRELGSKMNDLDFMTEEEYRELMGDLEDEEFYMEDFLEEPMS